MGEAALLREFERQPPREPLDSLPALWRDYMWRYVKAERQDPAQYYTRDAPDLVTAIRRAADSRGADGKLFNHQSRVWQPCRDEFAQNLITIKRTIKYAKSFDALYSEIKRVGERTEGIGPVTIYDVTCRLALWLDLEPERLYFHAGVTEGLRALDVPIPRGRDYLKRKELPKFFRNKNLELLESFLCGYRAEIERVMSG
jgi:hypothetical protein